MPDAQRRDKLPLMNGPTANSWPSTRRIRRQGAEKSPTRARLSVLGPFSKSHRILTAIFIVGLCPRNLPYTSRIRIASVKSVSNASSSSGLVGPYYSVVIYKINYLLRTHCKGSKDRTFCRTKEQKERRSGKKPCRSLSICYKELPVHL